MVLSREQKLKIIEKLVENLKKSKAGVFINFISLKTKDLDHLRRELKKKDLFFTVVKKTLLSKALKNAWGIDFDRKQVAGPIGLALESGDELISYKIVSEFEKQFSKPLISGGILMNKIISKDEALTLAKLPGKQELLQNLSLNLKSLFGRLIFALNFNQIKLLYLLSNIKK